MATVAQLEAGLKKAYETGNMQYARILGAEIVRARKDKGNLIPGTPVAIEAAETSLADKLTGAGEAALTVATGATGGAVGLIGGTVKGIADSLMDGTFGTPQGARSAAATAAKGAQAGTYAPRTETGQEYAANVGELASRVIPVAPVAAGTGAVGAAVRNAAPPVMAVTEQAVRAVPAAIRAVAEKVAPAQDGARGSVGAAATDMATLRREKSANLPVPIDLTLGAAGRNADQLAFEKEALKSVAGAPLRARAEKNNLQALQNFEAIIDGTGAESPDLAATGGGLVKTLSEGYKAAKNRTRAAYNVAENSPEALAAVDASPLIDHLNNSPSGLKTTALLDHARQYIKQLGIAEIGEDGMLKKTATYGIPNKTDVKTMEALRKEISQATGFEPSEIRDAAIIKKLIDTQTEPLAGPLYQKARAERTAQARKYENRAIVARLVNNKRGTDDAIVPVDEVFRRTVLNSSPEEITFLKRVLKTNGEAGNAAWRELEGETIKYLRDEATKGMGIDSADRPIVSPAKLHQAVVQLDKNGRLDLMLGKKNAALVRDLNDVVRYVNTVPPGTLVNSSGTAGMLMAAIAEAGATGAVTGLPVPVLSGLKMAFKGVRDAKTRARIKKALGD